MMRKTTFILVIFLSLGLSLKSVEKDPIRLKDVDVQAVRVKQFAEIGKVITVVDKEQISRMPVQSLDALLKSIPGVDIRQRGVGNTQSDISLRGSSFDQVMVMLNGVNITDPQTGHHNMNIPVDISEISRIEVLQGSAARRFGSQAFAGVINIVTDPGDKSFLSGEVSWGSYDTRNSRFSFKLGKRRLQHYSSFANQQSDGYRENTDYKNYNAFSQTVWKSRKIGTFDFQTGYQHKSFGAYGFYTPKFPFQFENTVARFNSLNWNMSLNKLDVKVLLFNRSHYDRFELFRDFKNAIPSYKDHNYHLTNVSGGSAGFRYKVNGGILSGGLEIKTDHILSNKLGVQMLDSTDFVKNIFEPGKNKFFTKEAIRFFQTAYVDYTGSFDNLLYSGGLSVIHSDEFGLVPNYGLDLSFVIDEKWTANGSFNTASRFPTYTDLYYTDLANQGNPDLKPEFSKTTELGVKFEDAGLNIHAGVFYRIGDDIIDWVKYPAESVWKSKNITSLNTLGAELSASYIFRSSAIRQIDLSWNFIQTDKQHEDFDSKYALDYAKSQLKLRATHAVLRKVDMTWNVLYTDRAGEYAEYGTGKMLDYQPYLTVGTRIGWRLGKWLIYADANNIFNQEYVDFGGLPLPGITAMMGLQWKLW
jgi:iron complex outermembrane receptor protein